MHKNTQIDGPDYSGNFYKAKATGAGCGSREGLTSVASALAAANIIAENASPTGAGAVQGVEAMTVGEALATCEQATTSLLAACQAEQDRRIVERSAYKLRARMQGDGKVISDDAFNEAQAAALYAVQLWRAGLTTTRDDGQDKLSQDDGEREKHVARVAWRGMVKFFSQDGFGSTVQLQGGAEDDWLCAQMLPSESRAERAARYWIGRHAKSRQELLVRRLANITDWRGRRKAVMEKVQNALGLVLGGDSLDTAALAAGFKQRGRNRPGDALLRACKRLELISDGFSIKRRGH